ncbi:hypothetical protein DPMN_118638 [Dreissena polymorpha]|uniref:Uncharacterized protein n=1 Tax=Dreissena polymorpha TaxID=45954 RepID=A0A9D4GKI5_DREPO|nr:hypothetical protein DPMN_118638 [Dreissena polymorpha]
MCQEPSPLLVKASEDSAYDGEESRDTFMTDPLDETGNTSLDNFTFASHAEVTPKATAKKVRSIAQEKNVGIFVWFCLFFRSEYFKHSNLIFSSAVFGENPRYCHSQLVVRHPPC